MSALAQSMKSFLTQHKEESTFSEKKNFSNPHRKRKRSERKEIPANLTLSQQSSKIK